MKFFTFIWAAFAAALTAIFLEQGRMIGGVQYFVHMGHGFSAALQLALIAGCALLAIAMWSGKFETKFLAAALATGASIYCLSLFSNFFPFPIGLLLSQIGPYTYPSGLFGVAVPAAVAITALGTAIYSANQER